MAISFLEAIAKKTSNIGVGSVIGAGVSGYFMYDTYKNSRNEGNGAIVSGAKALGEQAVMSATGLGLYTAFQAVPAIAGLGVKGYEALASQARSMANLSANRPFQNVQFNDSQQAFTMRQAGMKLAEASKYNIQQATLGNEANFLHM